MNKEEKKQYMKVWYQKNKRRVLKKQQKIRDDAKIVSTLEKRNTKLKKLIEQMQDAKCISCTDLGGMLLKITDLEKRNAELEHTIAELRRDKDNLNTHTKAQEKLSEYRSDQLTKAKEILVKLLEEEKDNMYWEMNGSDKSSYYEVRKQAEQFLKEIEK